MVGVPVCWACASHSSFAALDENLPLARVHLASDHFERGGFARAVDAQQTEALALADADADAANGFLTVCIPVMRTIARRKTQLGARPEFRV